MGEEIDVLPCPRIEPHFLSVAVRSLVMVLAPSPETPSGVVLRRMACHLADILSNEGPVGARDGLAVKALRYKPVGRGFDSR